METLAEASVALDVAAVVATLPATGHHRAAAAVGASLVATVGTAPGPVAAQSGRHSAAVGTTLSAAAIQ